ncbi:hypothetical protein CCR75_000360 [Bremia lactucae]|uniref:ABC transporter domain-containing protein n=1 Tax=Bremia lactucae TaxID=4779 RepID=A0A976FQ00_BRELC|nr:hypothetical protein CCR75_000360 [Bremia lactucae]
MARARQSDRKIKRKPNSSHKFTPLSAKDFSSSVSSVSSEPTPILDMLVHSYRKQGLHRHFHARSSRQREISTRSGPRDSLFTPRRPVGAVPELFVTFRHVSLALDVPTPSALAAAASNQTNRETLASNQLSAIKNSVQSAFAVLTLSKTVTHRQILKNVTGAFIPGSMTIILGRSGSGKSMLLKLLSGRLNVSKDNVTLDGEVSYSGLSRKDLKTQLPQCIAYVPQQDLHLSGMTVKETLDFAFECCAINADASVVNTVCKARASEYLSTRPMMNLTGERDPVTVIRELGLTRCQETIVGDERIRGVSGGEKKRLTAGEMAFGLHAVSMMDEITTGLDSSSAYDIVNAQRRLARQQRQTVVISLQQPTPEIWALFDNVLLLAEGEVLYHGPRDHVQAYFEALGFVCPPKRDLADFLCDLASPQQIQYEQLHAPLPGRRRHPRNANEFADLWMMSPVYEAMVEELDCVDNDTEAYSQRHCKYEDKRLYLDQQTLLQVPAFRQSFLHSTWTVIKRQMRLFGRNKVFIVSRLVQDLLVGIMVGSVYYGMDLADVQVVSGVVFSCTLFLGLGQSATLSTFFDARQVFYKHRGANFYRSSSYVFATCLSQVPLAITEALIFGSLVYWLGGLVNSLEQFVVFVLYMFLTVIVFVGEYFFLSCACATLPVAQVISTFALLFYILFAGFAVSREQLPLALRWIYWCNPLAWTTRGILVSQYRSNILDVCEYGGIDYCRMFNGKTLGIYSLGLYDVPDNPKWVILGILFLTISLVVINLLSYSMLEYYRHESTLVLPLTSLSETILARQSYAMLSTPRGDADEFHEIDMTEIQARNELLVRDVNKDISDSFFASQGVPTDPKDVFMRLATQWNVPPVTLAFHDLRYTIAVPAVDCEGQHGIEGASDRPVGFGSCSKAGESKKTESRELLKGVTGYALPGTMTALMGSTGAGKTTLMDVLAGRKIETIKPQSSVPMKSKPTESTATTIPHHQQLDASTTSSASLEHVRQEPLDFVTAYKAGRLKQRLDAKRAAPGVFMPSDRLRPVAFNQRQAASNGQQLSMLVRRFVRLYWRTPDYSTNRIVMALTLGLIFGLVYSGSNDFTTYQGANGALIAEAVATNTTINVSGWPLGCQPLTDAPPTLANITLKTYIEHVFGASRDDTAGSIGVVVGLLLIMRLATLVVMRLVNLQKR